VKNHPPVSLGFRGLTIDGDRTRSRNAVGITKLEIPNTVTSIEKDAFAGCTGLTEVTLNGFSEENWRTEAGIANDAFPDGTKFKTRTGGLSPAGWLFVAAFFLFFLFSAVAIDKKNKGRKNKKKNQAKDDNEATDVTENPSGGKRESKCEGRSAGGRGKSSFVDEIIDDILS